MPVFGPTDITVVLGQRGSGKSTLCKKIAEVYPRLFVIDLLREWGDDDADFITDDFNEFCKILLFTLNRPTFKIVFQFDVESDDDSRKVVFNEVMRLIYKRGIETQTHAAILIEEVHHYASSHSIEKWLRNTTLFGRHARLALLCNSQRPARVHKDIISQANHVCCFRLTENADLDYLEERLGQAVEKLPQLPQFSFLVKSSDGIISILKNK